MNPNFKKKKPLPYKNLGELYIETAYHEPSISRLVSVLLEDGTVDVISQDTSDPGAPAQDYKVDKDYFEKIIKPKLELGRPARDGHIEGIEVRNIIEARLIKAGPADNPDGTTDIYQKFIESLSIVLNENFTSNFGDKLIGNNTVESNFSDLLKTTYNLEKNPSDSDNPDPDSPGPALWYSVFEALPSPGRGGGRGRPGEGELFISFFSDTKRPTTGDVEIKGVKIEVKGLEGRLYAPAGAKLEKLLVPADFLLADPAAKPEEQQKRFIVDFIIKLAGGGDAGPIEALVQLNLLELYNEIISSMAGISRNKKRLTVSVNETPLLTQIVGAQHLLLYKKAHGFTNFLIFNKSLDPSGSIPFICFKVPDTLSGMLNIFIEYNISITTVTHDQSGHKILWPASL